MGDSATHIINWSILKNLSRKCCDKFSITLIKVLFLPPRVQIVAVENGDLEIILERLIDSDEEGQIEKEDEVYDSDVENEGYEGDDEEEEVQEEQHIYVEEEEIQFLYELHHAYTAESEVYEEIVNIIEENGGGSNIVQDIAEHNIDMGILNAVNKMVMVVECLGTDEESDDDIEMVEVKKADVIELLDSDSENSDGIEMVEVDVIELLDSDSENSDETDVENSNNSYNDMEMLKVNDIEVKDVEVVDFE
ncbi:uncharacterized protein [Prorops nasuta]|uniref:uncharacterized protein n=1 Tax=Prorops nasuta TaxID=863751 RepID=UPI0034CECCD9